MERSAKRALLFTSLLVCNYPRVLHASIAETGNISPGAEIGGYQAAVLDQIDGFAYFASSISIPTVPPQADITPITLSPFTYFGSELALSSSTMATAGAFDPTTDFIYFVSSQTTPIIQAAKVNLFPPFGAFISSMSINSGSIRALVLDTMNHFAYVGTQTSPSLIIKLQIPDGVSITSFTVVSTITLPSPALDFVSAGLIDVTGGFAYFASSSTPGAVAKIQLSNFTQVGTLTFNAGEGGVGSAVIDTTHQMAYFGTHDSPGKVVQVGLSGLTRVGSLTMQSGQNDLTSAAADVAQSFAYFGTNTSPGQVIQVRLSANTEVASLALPSGQNFLTSAVLDPVNEFAYFGTFTNPGFVIQIDLLAGLPTITGQPTGATGHPGDTANFFIAATGRSLTYQWQFNGVNIAGATATTYSRVLSSADDGSTVDCVVTDSSGSVVSNAAAITILPTIKVFPNPWRVDRHAGLNITFNGVLPNSTIKIFNLAAHWVRTLPLASGNATWDLTNDSGENVASGYYFYTVTTGNDKQTVTGKIAIIH